MQSLHFLLYEYNPDETINDPVTFYSQHSLESWLRSHGQKLSTGTLSSLGNDSLRLGKYEVELLVEEEPFPDHLLLDGKHYTSIKRYCKEKNLTPRQARYAISQGRLSSLAIGRENRTYIEETE